VEWPAEGFDRYGGQMGWATVNNRLCPPSAGYSIRLRRTQPLAGSAHSNRDVQYAIAASDFAPEFRHLVGRACRIGRRRDRLADATLKTFAARLERGATNSPGKSRNARLGSNASA
jgi:transposase